MPKKIRLHSDIGVIRTFKVIENKHHFAIGEFVDNSIQSFLDNETKLRKKFSNYSPIIEIFVSKNEIEIIDNCSGISDKDAERAFSIAAPNPNQIGIGTFGMGMKVSACWYTNTWTVQTKHINEDRIKEYNIDVEKILKTNDLDIGPVEKTNEGRPFTRVLLKEPFKDKRPRSAQVADIKTYIADMYRFFLENKIVEIYYNGDPIFYISPPVKVMPYIKGNQTKELIWKTKIPRLDLGDGFWAEGEAYLREKGNTTKQRGFGIFWKRRLVTGSVLDPWMPNVDHFDNKKDRDKYGIYAGANQAINQRLEGYLEISPKFEVPSTKNGVLWEGKDLMLMAKLKQYLKDCPVADDEFGKKYNFLEQAKKGSWSAKNDRQLEEYECHVNESAFKDFKKQDYLPDISKITEVSNEEEDAAENFEFSEKEVVHKSFEYEDKIWKLGVSFERDEKESFLKKVESRDESEASDNIINLKVNLGHPFVRRFFGDKDAKEGILRFCRAFIIAETVAKEGANNAVSVRRRLCDILDQMEK